MSYEWENHGNPDKKSWNNESGIDLNDDGVEPAGREKWCPRNGFKTHLCDSDVCELEEHEMRQTVGLSDVLDLLDDAPHGVDVDAFEVIGWLRRRLSGAEDTAADGGQRSPREPDEGRTSAAASKHPDWDNMTEVEKLKEMLSRDNLHIITSQENIDRIKERAGDDQKNSGDE